ncbi:MAG: hypothetical protein AABZ53_14285 [Planctomycetota bacterium]
MSKSLFKWVDSLLVFFVVGPLAGMLIASLRAVDGDRETTPLTSATPLLGALYLLVAGVAACLCGLLGGRLFGRGRGYTLAGLVFGWVAWRTGNARMVLGDLDSGANLLLLAGEGVLAGAIALGAAMVIERFCHLSAEDQGRPGNADLPAPTWAQLLRPAPVPAMLLAMFAAALTASVLAWLFAFSVVKGQCLLAAIIAGVGAGVVSQLILAPKLPDRPAPIWIPLAAMILVAVASAVVARVVLGADVIAAARGTGSIARLQLWPLNRILPLDWIAGALLGARIGTDWAASMLERGVHHADGAQPHAS